MLRARDKAKIWIPDGSVVIPIGDSDFLFVPRWQHAEYSIFSYFFSELKIHHLSLFSNTLLLYQSSWELLKLRKSHSSQPLLTALDVISLAQFSDRKKSSF